MTLMKTVSRVIEERKEEEQVVRPLLRFPNVIPSWELPCGFHCVYLNLRVVCFPGEQTKSNSRGSRCHTAACLKSLHCRHTTALPHQQLFSWVGQHWPTQQWPTHSGGQQLWSPMVKYSCLWKRPASAVRWTAFVTNSHHPLSTLNLMFYTILVYKWTCDLKLLVLF